MEIAIADIIRGCVSGAMNAMLLFLIAQPRYSKKITGCAIFFVFFIDVFASIMAIKIGGPTALAKFDILLFLALSIVLKPFVKDSLMQWLFHFLTAVNIYFMIVFCSYYLSELFPYPIYASSFVRFGLYVAIMFLYSKVLRPIYRTITEDWKIYFVLVFSITINFAYYVISSENIERTFDERAIELMLLTILTILVYATIFSLLHKERTRKTLSEEKLYLERIAYMDMLTGVGNRTAYEKYVQRLENTLNKESICVGVFDINNLKMVNDTMGHSEGDKYIYNCCQIICRAHKTSSVFRIGGDEFVIISTNIGHNFIEESVNAVEELTVEYNRTNAIYKGSVAYGYQLYDYKKHQSIDDVKNDADKLMYENKKIMKAVKL